MSKILNWEPDWVWKSSMVIFSSALGLSYRQVSGLAQLQPEEEASWFALYALNIKRINLFAWPHCGVFYFHSLASLLSCFTAPLLHYFRVSMLTSFNVLFVISLFCYFFIFHFFDWCSFHCFCFVAPFFAIPLIRRSFTLLLFHYSLVAPLLSYSFILLFLCYSLIALLFCCYLVVPMFCHSLVSLLPHYALSFLFPCFTTKRNLQHVIKWLSTTTLPL